MNDVIAFFQAVQDNDLHVVRTANLDFNWLPLALIVVVKNGIEVATMLKNALDRNIQDVFFFVDQDGNLRC